jgi:hypothetical protein
MDIVDDLRKDPYEEERQYNREARLELGGILDKAANEIVKLRKALRKICLIPGSNIKTYIIAEDALKEKE